MKLAQVLTSTDVFHQQVAVTALADRRPLFVQRCTNRSVLHVGCCDVPVFDPDTNLHLALASHTDRLDGLDVSAEGIKVLQRYVAGAYFTASERVDREYDLVLAPEVLEHTANPNEFLRGLFSVRASEYFITAPDFGWRTRARLEGGVFHEEVHEDHKAWYSPYTLLRTLRPFIEEATDEVEVFLFANTGSVGVSIKRPFTPVKFAGRGQAVASSVEAALAQAEQALVAGDTARALAVLEAARTQHEDTRLVQVELTLLSVGGQNVEVLRRGVQWLKTHPADKACLLLCATAAEALGDHATAERWRSAAR